MTNQLFQLYSLIYILSVIERVDRPGLFTKCCLMTYMYYDVSLYEPFAERESSKQKLKKKRVYND